MFHTDDYIYDEHKRRRYLVTCDAVLPMNHVNPLRRGQVCGARRYLRISDAKRVKMCHSCSQRLKGKKGYKSATQKVQSMGYNTLPSQYLERHPSRAESLIAHALDCAGVLFETNVRVPNSVRCWLMDVFVEPNLCIEIDDPWIHEKRVAQDAEKDADMRAAGIHCLRVSIDAKKPIPKQVEKVMPMILQFLQGESDHV